ncbi:hypothetical protein [Natronorubrum bangense]|uniref:Zinc-ribbon domain-containing protein n=2 Tax=Natronorubrum bangense TaxID=61858 RepID=L9W455_9EURY|nr:hypothetical protein [Natronorubrum bangense]ELY44107.1 hypothetical protein C494_16973 [Natronorubrum bangense JCM 10635]QCC55609.1 hypothetical protein DV706_14715 [Natronorubrum bangense]
MQRQHQPSQESNPSRLRTALAAVLRRDGGQTVIEECRHCGTTLESGSSNCPSCGCTEIASYRIE